MAQRYSSEWKKIAGILIEVTNKIAVVGIGLNLNQPSFPRLEESRIEPTSLYQATKSRVEPQPALIDLLKRLEEGVKRLTGRAKRTDLIQRYNSRLHLNGQAVEVWLPEGKVSRGKCYGLNHQGHLHIETDEGIKQFVSGTMQAI